MIHKLENVQTDYKDKNIYVIIREYIMIKRGRLSNFKGYFFANQCDKKLIGNNCMEGIKSSFILMKV